MYNQYNINEFIISLFYVSTSKLNWVKETKQNKNK